LNAPDAPEIQVSITCGSRWASHRRLVDWWEPRCLQSTLWHDGHPLPQVVL